MSNLKKGCLWSCAGLAVLIGIVAVGTALDESSKKRLAKDNKLTPEETTELVKNAVKKLNAWKSIGLRDKFGNVIPNAAVVSATKPPIRKMDFPYHDVKAEITYQCVEPESIFIDFTDSPNLVGEDTHDGFNSILLDIAVNNEQQSYQWEAYQTWGSKRLSFQSDVNNFSVLREHLSGDTFSISIPWYGEGNVTFTWNTENAIEAINETCG